MYSETQLNCLVVDCGDPTVANAHTTGSLYGTTTGSEATFECDNGYSLTSGTNFTAECNQNGHWFTSVECGNF